MQSPPPLFTSRSFHVLVVLFTTFSLICTRIPLFNYLGFEFSALTALLAGYCAGLLFILRRRAGDSSPVVKQMGTAVSASFLLLAVCFAVLSLNALLVKNCSYFQGVILFLLLPVPSVLFTVSLAALVCALFRRFWKIWYTVFFLLILLHIAFVTFLRPQIFAFNPIVGFFPGITYDESLNVEGRLFIYRIGTILASAILTGLARILGRRNPARGRWRRLRVIETVSGSLGILLLAALFSFSNELGLSSSEGYIAKELGGQYETEHFVIHYPAVNVSADRARRLALLHEFTFSHLERELRVVPLKKIHSFVYPSPEEKGRLIGAAGTNIAKPWLWQFHINLGDVEGSLKHELVHVMAAEFGFPLLRISLNSGLIEGLAVAVERVEYDETVHRLAAEIFGTGLNPDVESLFSLAGFLKNHGATSYVLAGSFCRYLIDQYGLRRFKLLYRTGSFGSFYNKELTELLAEWRRSIGDPAPSGAELQKGSYLFRRPSIFGKECARVIAALNQDTRELLRQKKFEEALRTSTRSLELTKNTEAILQRATSTFRLRRYDDAIQFAEEALKDSAVAHVLLPLYLIAGDSYWFRDRIPEALEMYRGLYGVHLSLLWDEACGIRLAALQDRRLITELKGFLASDMPDSARIDWLREQARTSRKPMLQYLLGRELMAGERYAETIDVLGTIKQMDSGILEFVRHRRLARSHFELGEFQKAKAYFWESLNFTSKASHQIETNEWLERCDWMEENASRFP